ncbi:hypothetical protein EYF80_027269 [Liparis tanakae]|uniref:Uncharacterized protein n=1 Tax=Liparis tanakae TaxID=230148 RepID=A0A4Z2H9M3_9TELE|nr:hypothetical protein EYF80_027269 [Liparis tanakae]
MMRFLSRTFAAILRAFERTGRLRFLVWPSSVSLGLHTELSLSWKDALGLPSCSPWHRAPSSSSSSENSDPATLLQLIVSKTGRLDECAARLPACCREVAAFADASALPRFMGALRVNGTVTSSSSSDSPSHPLQALTEEFQHFTSWPRSWRSGVRTMTRKLTLLFHLRQFGEVETLSVLPVSLTLHTPVQRLPLCRVLRETWRRSVTTARFRRSRLVRSTFAPPRPIGRLRPPGAFSLLPRRCCPEAVVMLFELEEPVSRYRLPVSRYRLPVSRYRLPVSRYRLPVSRYRLPGLLPALPGLSAAEPPGYRGHRGHRIQEPRHRPLVTSPVQEHGSSRVPPPGRRRVDPREARARAPARRASSRAVRRLLASGEPRVARAGVGRRRVAAPP